MFSFRNHFLNLARLCYGSMRIHLWIQYYKLIQLILTCTVQFQKLLKGTADVFNLYWSTCSRSCYMTKSYNETVFYLLMGMNGPLRNSVSLTICMRKHGNKYIKATREGAWLMLHYKDSITCKNRH